MPNPTLSPESRAKGRTELYGVLSRSAQPQQFLASLRTKFTQTGMIDEYLAFLDVALSSRLAEKTDGPLTLMHIVDAICAASFTAEKPAQSIRALETCKAIPEIASNPHFMALEGVVLFAASRHAAAKHALRVGLQMYPKDLGLLLADAAVALATHNYQNAMDRYRTIFLHAAEPPQEAFVGLALLHDATGDVAKAHECVDFALTAPASHTEVLRPIELKLYRRILALRAGHSTAPPFGEVLSDITAVPAAQWAQSPLVVWAVCETVVRSMAPEKALEFLRSLEVHTSGEAAAFVEYSLARAHQAGGHPKEALTAYQQSFLNNSAKNAHPSLTGLIQLSHAMHCALPEGAQPVALGAVHGLEAKRRLAHILLNTESSEISKYVHALTAHEGANDAECWTLKAIADRGSAIASKNAAMSAVALAEAGHDPRAALLAKLNLHALHLTTGDTAAAADLLNEILHISSMNDCHKAVLLYNYAVGKFHAGDFAGAAALFEESMALGGVLDALFGLACCAYKQMDHARCVELAEHFTRLAPDHQGGLLLLSSLGVPLPQPLESLDKKTQSLLYTQEGNAFFLAVLANVSAGCAPEANVVTAALQSYQKALQVFPSNIIAQHNAAVVLRFSGANSTAQTIFENVVAVQPDAEVQHSALVNLGDLSCAAGRYARACGYYEKAMHSKGPSVGVELARSKFGAGDVAGALTTIKESEISVKSGDAHVGAVIGSISLEIVSLMDTLGGDSVKNAGEIIAAIEGLEKKLKDLRESAAWTEADESRVQQASECEELLKDVRAMCHA